MLAPRAVVVHRRTELEELTTRHGTRQHVEFRLRSRGREIEELQARHTLQHAALNFVSSAIPLDWRRGEVERGDLSRFTFSAEDVIVAVGQDGLVANVAKYLDGQPVIGINPEPGRNPGVLVPHAPETATAHLTNASQAGSTHLQQRTMVEVLIDDGQSLRALNEVYIGHPGHQSARYRITVPDAPAERQSSSGVLIGTGTGSTGWCRSVALERHSTLDLPDPEGAILCWFVREAWPSPATGTTRTEGLIQPDQDLTITAESDLVIFGDGIEQDAIPLTWGQPATVRVAAARLNLVL